MLPPIHAVRNRSIHGKVQSATDSSVDSMALPPVAEVRLRELVVGHVGEFRDAKDAAVTVEEVGAVRALLLVHCLRLQHVRLECTEPTLLVGIMSAEVDLESRPHR